MIQPDARCWLLAILRITRQMLLDGNILSTIHEIDKAIRKLEGDLKGDETSPSGAGKRG